MLEVAGDLRRVPAKFENPVMVSTFDKCICLKKVMKPLRESGNNKFFVSWVPQCSMRWNQGEHGGGQQNSVSHATIHHVFCSLILAGKHLPWFQCAQPDHMQARSSTSCFSREVRISFHPWKLVSFDPGHNRHDIFYFNLSWVFELGGIANGDS